MEQLLLSSLDKLTTDALPDELSAFYSLLSDCDGNEIDDKVLFKEIIPNIYWLCDRKVLKKDLIYLSFLATDNSQLLEKFLIYDKSVVQINIDHPPTLYDYSIYKKQHWLHEIVNNIDKYDKNLRGGDQIRNKLFMLKFIQLTNSSNINIAEINLFLKNIKREELDEFWNLYINEIQRLTDITKFCLNLNSDQNDSFRENENDIYYYASKNSLLETLSKYLNFENSSNWQLIKNKLKNYETTLNGEANESDIFEGFTILLWIINTIIAKDNETTESTNNIITIKDKIIHIKSKQIQIELIENIFALITCKIEKKFLCNEKSVRMLLFLLKGIFDEIKLEKSIVEYERYLTVNKYLKDALWRLDLITNVKSNEKTEKDLLKYMLAPAQTLIYMCLKRGDFHRAYQVVEIFNLNKTDIATEICYDEKLEHFKIQLNNKMKYKQNIIENTSTEIMNGSVIKFVNEFFDKNPNNKNEKIEKNLTDSLEKFNYLSHYQLNNEKFMNLVDLAITQTYTKDDCEILLNIAQKNCSLDQNISSNYSKTFTKLIELFNIIGNSDNVSLSQILTTSNYPLDVEVYNKNLDYYQKLANLFDEFNEEFQRIELGKFNNEHNCHKIILKLNETCRNFIDLKGTNKNYTEYLLKFYNYLKAFSQVLFIEADSSLIVTQDRNTSYFELLYYNRSELMGELLFGKNLDPTEFEKHFNKLKLDFLYHVIGNCFPTINLYIERNLTKEELFHENTMYTPSINLLEYIQKSNWLLVYILSKIYKINVIKFELNTIQLQALSNYLQLSKIQHLKPLFENNEMITALQNTINFRKLKLYLKEQIFQPDLQSINSCSSVETAKELVEDNLKSTDWKSLLNIMESLSEVELKENPEISQTRDNILANLVQDSFEVDYYKYAFFIKNHNLRRETILNNFKKWPSKFCLDIINAELTKFGCEIDSKLTELIGWISKIQLCEELRETFSLDSWYRAYELCQEDSENILLKLLQIINLNLLLKFIQIFTPTDNILSHVDLNFIITIIDLNTTITILKQLFAALSLEHSLDICRNLLKTLKKLEYLQFAADYLNQNNQSYKNILISLKILSVFNQAEQEQFFCLINNPLDIIEVLIMNTKLDKLSNAIQIVHEELQHSESTEIKISIEEIDELIRIYAEKSLDFRIITQPHPRLLKTPEFNLMQSLESLNMGSDKKLFIMPETIPTRDEWTQNNEIIECMCCQEISFSMFNRRHHCRRCGRVICYNCSTKRMLVASYGDILVRVCNDCYEQSGGESVSSEKSEAPSLRSFGHEYWSLNNYPEHNKIVRQEFSYEHAPSVSLCLSIMKYHSQTAEYPQFLLNQCTVLLKLLQANQEMIQEIDYTLVIKMLKSLAIAAKMSSAASISNNTASIAERILTEADLLHLLAQHGCLNLMPTNLQGCYIDATLLRRLRDKLLQREQYHLALEVTTKGGLDITGVFAAWGKSCLKAGNLSLAREKFQRCLDRGGHFETLSLHSKYSDLYRSLDNISIRSSMTSSLSGFADNKPSKDPQLLYEIIHILEQKTIVLDNSVLEGNQNIKLTDSISSSIQNSASYTQSNLSLSIFNKIKNLNEIIDGNYVKSNSVKKFSYTKPPIDPIFYDECIYYLNKYGTHYSLLDFYIKHGEIQKVLNYIIENSLIVDIFVDVYLKCLKYGIVGILQEYMSKMDSSLNMWRDYLIQICCYLEKQSLLNSLYQLQLFMGDYLRAAMTCIRFYRENVTNFTELSSNTSHLFKAENHLTQILEQEQWVEVASVGKSEDPKECFEAKLVTNSNLILKININNVNKHIHTIKTQIKIVSFLVERENCGFKSTDILKELSTVEDNEKKLDKQPFFVPTLFGTHYEKMCLAVLVMIAGDQIEDGFQLALDLIKDFNLKAIKVYCLTGKILAKAERYESIMELVNCIKLSGTNTIAISNMLDEMLMLAVGTLIKSNVSGSKVESLIKLIKDRASKISTYIEAKQLKTAYFLAVKYKRFSDIRRIQREAELLNQPSIKALCQKVLQNYSTQGASHSKS